MSEYLVKIKDLATPIVELHQKKLVDVKLRKEFGTNIISIIIDDPITFSMDVDEVATINMAILDATNDLIPDGYYLEVTTPGIERELITSDDFNKAIGKYVYLKTYQKQAQAYDLKEITGTLVEVTNDGFNIEITSNKKTKIITIKKDDVAKIRLAIDFRRNN